MVDNEANPHVEDVAEENEPRFSVIARKREYDEALYLHDLTFARLIDDVVLPYETKKPFFIDGVSVQQSDLLRIKIVQQEGNFSDYFRDLHYYVQREGSGKKVKAEDYPQKLDALFRGFGEDVTAQVIKAYRAAIGPRIKEYLPNRKEFISATFRLFAEAIKHLAAGATNC